MGYAYVWEFRIRPEAVAAFEATYGPSGAWVRLFREEEGYEGTELLRDRVDALRFWTIDRWRSKEDWQRCRKSSAAAFEALDLQCEALTESEIFLGEFASLANAASETSR